MRFSKVLLLFPDYEGGHFGALRPPAGLGYLAESLQAAGIDYDILDMAAGYPPTELDARLADFQPDLVGLSVMSFMYDRTYEIVRHVKRSAPAARVVLGGPHVSILKEEVLRQCPQADYAIMLEGEATLVELCRGDDIGQIGSLVHRHNDRIVANDARPLFDDLDALAFPRYQKFPLDRYITEEIGIVSSRGCPYSCIYCPVRGALGRTWRKRSANNIVEEIRYWHDRGYWQFSILDDNFAFDKSRVVELCEQILAGRFEGIELNCNNGIRADHVNREVLEAMKRAGFEFIAFGVESGNDKVLRSIRKGQTVAVADEAVRLALEAGFKVTLFFLVGSPGETPEDIQDSIDFAMKYPVFDARFYNLIPFPKSELFDWVEANHCFVVDPESYLNSSSQWDETPVFETPELPLAQRVTALKKVHQVRKTIRRRSMKSALNGPLGPLAGPVAALYVTDWMQERLMKNARLRRSLKRMFRRATQSPAPAV